MGTITRIIKDQSNWVSLNEFDIISKENDTSFTSITKVALDGKENGHIIGTYNHSEENDNNDKDFPYGWWSYDFDGRNRVEPDKRNKTGFRSSLERTVFFQLDVHNRIPTGTIIQFQLYDYDTGLFMDWLNPDDQEFEGKQIFKTATVKEFEGKKRITVELYLHPNWRENLVEDNGCLDFYWKWAYGVTDWNSEQLVITTIHCQKFILIKEI